MTLDDIIASFLGAEDPVTPARSAEPSSGEAKTVAPAAAPARKGGRYEERQRARLKLAGLKLSWHDEEPVEF